MFSFSRRVLASRSPLLLSSPAFSLPHLTSILSSFILTYNLKLLFFPVLHCLISYTLPHICLFSSSSFFVASYHHIAFPTLQVSVLFLLSQQ